MLDTPVGRIMYFRIRKIPEREMKHLRQQLNNEVKDYMLYMLERVFVWSFIGSVVLVIIGSVRKIGTS
jgi:hypothetical protein